MNTKGRIPGIVLRTYVIVRNVSAAMFVVLLLLVVTPLVPWMNRFLVADWASPEGDVLVVLGAGMLDDNYIDPTSMWRATTALRAWEVGDFQMVIASGGDPDPAPPSVAGQIAELLVLRGVPTDRVLVEDRSLSTRENALFTAKLAPAGAKRIVVVTSDYHVWRTQRAFARAGLKVRVLPHADIGKHWNRFSSRPGCVITVFTEYAKIGYYWLKGWV